MNQVALRRDVVAEMAKAFHQWNQDHNDFTVQTARRHWQPTKEEDDAAQALSRQPSFQPEDAGLLEELPSLRADLPLDLHQIGRRVAEIAGQFSIPIAYDATRSRRTMRVNRLFFKPTQCFDVKKFEKIAENANFLVYAGLSSNITIHPVAGGVEIHQPLPSSLWQFPGFGSPHIQLVHSDHKSLANGLQYVLGLDLDEKPIVLSEILHMMTSGITGSGKSQHLRSKYYQYALTYPPTLLRTAFFDITGATFKLFGSDDHDPTWRRFPWLLFEPCVGEEQYLLGMNTLRAEALRREEKFSYHGIYDLEEWNQRRPSQALPYIAVEIEEFGTVKNRVGKKDANAVPTAIAEAHRKQGFFLGIADTRPDRDNYDSVLLGNLGHRVVFKAADDGTSQVAFGNRKTDGKNLLKKGDGYICESDVLTRFQSFDLGPDKGRDKLRKLVNLAHSLHQQGKQEYATPALMPFSQEGMEPDLNVDCWEDS